MKKAIRSKRGKVKPETVDEYLAGVLEPARNTLKRIRATIQSAVPPETTEIISYGIPAFKYKETLMWFAAFSDHCSLFPKMSVLRTFKNELKAYEVSKGTIHFPVDKPLPAALLKRMVKARVAEVEQKRSSASPGTL